jgi:hypothetical protein
MALRKSRASAASSAEIEAAAEEVLAKGNAVDAVVAGVFTACATTPGALLGPVQLLVGGGGAGLRAIDGRVRQPGASAPRPRGFTKDEEIPDAARVGVPWLPATLSVALATMGSATMAQVMGPALAAAKGTPRSEVLAKIAARGPRAIEERPLSSELLAVCGRPSGGLLTADDLSSPRPEVLAAARVSVGAGKVLLALPWAHVEDGAITPPASVGEVGSARAVAAVDRHGTFALAVWEDAPWGLRVGDLELRAPFFAEPVLRGQTRARPGEPRPASAPIAMVGGATGPEVAFAALGVREAYVVLAEAVRGLVEAERIEAHGEARLIALSHAKGTASAFRS